MTVRSGTSRSTMGIVTNYGMPVRWSTAHYRFSRAPCTATLYAPSVSCSLVHLVLSLFFVVDLSPEFPSLFYQPRPSSHSRSVTVAPCHLCVCCFSLAHTLPPEYCVLTEIAVVCFSLSLIYHPPPDTITEFSHSVYRRCCPPLPPPTFPPTIAISPSGSVSLHLSTILVLSLLLDLCSPSFTHAIRLLSAPY